MSECWETVAASLKSVMPPSVETDQVGAGSAIACLFQSGGGEQNDRMIMTEALVVWVVQGMFKGLMVANLA